MSDDEDDLNYDDIGAFSASLSQLLSSTNNNNENEQQSFRPRVSMQRRQQQVAPQHRLSISSRDSFNSKNNPNYVSSSGASVISRANASASINRRNMDETLERLAANVERQKESMGKDSLEVATNMAVLAKVQCQRGEHEQALGSYSEVLRVRTLLQGEDHPDVGKTLRLIGLCFFHAFNYEEALRHYEASLAVLGLQESDSASDADMATLLSDLGSVQFELNNLKEALDYFSQSIEIYESNLSSASNNIQAASIYVKMGDVLLDMKTRNKDALDSYMEALSIRETKLGENHIEVANTLAKIAEVHITDGNFEASVEANNKSLRIKKMRLGGEHPSVAETLSVIGEAHAELGMHEDAIYTYEEAVGIRRLKVQEINAAFLSLGAEKTASDSHNSLLDEELSNVVDELRVAVGYVAELYQLMGKSFEAMGDFDRALGSYQESMGFRELSKKGDIARDPDIIEIKENIAIVSYKVQDYDTALNTFHDILQSQLEVDPNSLEVATSLTFIGLLLFNKGEISNSMNSYEKAKRIFGLHSLEESHDGVENARVGMNKCVFQKLLNEGDQYVKDGDNIEGQKCYMEALELRNDLGDDFDKSMLLKLLFTSASVKIKNEDYDAAFQLLTEYKDIVKSEKGPESLAYAEALANLADVYKEQGEYDNTLETYTKAMDLVQNKVGREHRIYAKITESVGETYRAKGEFNNALKYYTEALQIKKRLEGEESASYADTLYLVGLVRLETRNFPLAMEIFLHNLRLRMKLLSIKKTEWASASADYKDKLFQEVTEAHGYVADSHHGLGLVQKNMNQIEEAFKSFQAELDLRKNQFGDHHPCVASVHESIGLLHLETGNCSEAMRMLSEALRVRQLKLGADHIDVASTWQNIGAVYFALEKLNEAKNAFTQSINIRQRQLGCDDKTLIEPYTKLGDICLSMNDEDDAILNYLEARRLIAEFIQEDNRLLAPLLIKLGDAYSRLGSHNLAMDSYKDAAQVPTFETDEKDMTILLLEKIAATHCCQGENIEAVNLFCDIGRYYSDKELIDEATEFYIKALKVDTGETITDAQLEASTILDELAVEHRSAGNNELALEAFKTAQVIKVKAPKEENSIDIAVSYQHIGDIYHQQDFVDKALHEFESALDLRTTAGDESVDKALLLEKIGGILFKKNKIDKALRSYGDALRIKREKLHQKHPSVAETLVMLGKLYEKEGDNRKALSCYEDALEIRIGKFGQNHLSVADIRFAIGDLYFKAGDFDKALTLFSNSINIIIEDRGEEDPEIAETYFKIGNINMVRGFTSEAIDAFEKALDIRRGLYEPQGREVTASLDALGRAYFAMGSYSQSMNLFTECLGARKSNLSILEETFQVVNNGEDICDYMHEYEKALARVNDALGDIAETYGHIAQVLEEQGEIQEALSPMKKCHDYHKAQHGMFHVDVAIAMERIGILLTKNLKFEEAEQSYLSSLKIRQMIQADLSPAFDSLGRLFTESNRLEAALKNLNCALTLRKRSTSNSKSMEVAETLSAISSLYLKRKENEEALKYAQEALDVAKALNGENALILRKYYVSVGQCHLTLDKNDALAAYGKAIEITKAICEKQPTLRNDYYATLLEQAGKCSFDLQNFDGALSNFSNALQIKMSIIGNDGEADPSIPALMTLAGQCYYKKRELDVAISHYVDAKSLRERIMNRAHVAYKESLSKTDPLCSRKALEYFLERLLDLAESHHKVGIIYKEKREYESAITEFEAELNVRKIGAGDAANVGVANVLDTLGITYYQMEDFDLSMSMFSQALHMKEQAMGSANNLGCATTMNHIGNVHWAKRDFFSAMDSYQTALRTKKDCLGINHLDIAMILNNIGNIHCAQRQFYDAIEIFEETLRIMLMNLGCDSTRVAEIQVQLGDAYFDSKSYEKALDYYKSSCDIYVKKRGSNSLEVAKSLDDLANVYAKLKQHEKSLTNLMSAYKIFEEKLGPTNARTMRVKEDMGIVYLDSGDYDKAEEILTQVLHTRRETLVQHNHKNNNDVSDDLLCAEILKALGTVYKQQEKYELALDILHESLALYELFKGNTTLEIGHMEHELGDIYFIKEDYDEALGHFKRALYVKRRNLAEGGAGANKEKVNLGKTLESIANLHQAQGNNEEAIKVLQELNGQ